MRHSTSNKHADIALRDLYRTENAFCEWAFYLGMTVESGKLKPQWEGLVIDGSDLNHIYSVGRRPDVWSNFTVLSRPAHRFFHDHIREGRVMCVLAKLRKRERIGRPEEFDLAELDFAAGRHVAGVIECYEFTDKRMRAWQRECVERLERIEDSK